MLLKTMEKSTESTYKDSRPDMFFVIHTKNISVKLHGEVRETLISYGFIRSQPVKNVMKKMLDFEYMDNVFDHER